MFVECYSICPNAVELVEDDRVGYMREQYPDGGFKPR